MAPLATPLRVCACARALADAGARTRVRTCEGAHISVCLGQRVSRPMAMWGRARVRAVVCGACGRSRGRIIMNV